MQRPDVTVVVIAQCHAVCDRLNSVHAFGAHVRKRRAYRQRARSDDERRPEGDGQSVAKELQYAPLPDDLHTKAMAKVDGLQCNGAAISGT